MANILLTTFPIAFYWLKCLNFDHSFFKFTPEGPTNNKSAMVPVLGTKPLPEPMNQFTGAYVNNFPSVS